MKTVLVIDHDTVTRELLYDMLTRRGAKVLAASSGRQVAELFKNQRPDLVLLNWALHDSSGPEMVRQIRAVDETIPIAALKGLGDPEISAEELKLAKVTDVLRAELGVGLFAAMIEQMLQRLDSQHSSGKPPPQPPPIRLLVVDDEPIASRMLQLLLQARGFSVLTAKSGEEALKSLQQKPELVLLDITMPGMDGLVTLKKIKALQPDLPVIWFRLWGMRRRCRKRARQAPPIL